MNNMNGINERFKSAVEKAAAREKGVHGSIGTQNERLIHAALKNYYAPFSDEQEIRLGGFIADAVSEDGIFEIQSAGLYRLRKKLDVFAEFSRVTVVYPVTADYRTVFIDADSGEIRQETPLRHLRSLIKLFEELYSIKNYLPRENVRIIAVRLSVERRVYFRGENIPDIRDKRVRKKCYIEKVPLEILEEIVLQNADDYRIFLPEGLPETFTKKELSKCVPESPNSKRAEVLCAAGVIQRQGKRGREIVYTLKGV